MPVFRDNDGNHYDISSEDLARFKVSGDLPEGTKLGGVQTEGGAQERIDPGAPRYYWPPIELLQRVVADLVNAANIGQAAHNYPASGQGGIARPAYFWDPGTQPQAAAAYNYASGAAYNYAGAAGRGLDPRVYNWAPDQEGPRAYNYAGGGAAYNYEPPNRGRR